MFQVLDRAARALTAVAQVKIGRNRGVPRLWLEGSKLRRSQFIAGVRFSVTQLDGKLVLKADEEGDRVVSRKTRGGGTIPVIDLNSAAVLALFDGLGEVRVICQVARITILPLVVDQHRRERLARLRGAVARGSLAIGSISHGGGVLTHALHAGLALAGWNAQLAFANEIRGDLLEQAADCNDAWNGKTMPLALPLQNLAFDSWVMANLPAVNVLEAGLPCSGASVAGRAKRGLKLPEEHPEVGHLVVGFIAVIAKVQPAVIVLENVPQYESSASMAILRNTLRDFGYSIMTAILAGEDWNELEHRKRMCMVAVTDGVTLDLAALQRPEHAIRHVGDVLDPVAGDAPCWSEMAGLKRKEARDAADGKGFAMQLVDASDTRCPTITKGYAKVRSTDPKLRHPSDGRLLRQFTPAEHARMKGIPERLVQGLSQTTAHELLGQSICYHPFAAVGELIGRALKATCEPVGKDARPLVRAA